MSRPGPLSFHVHVRSMTFIIKRRIITTVHTDVTHRVGHLRYTTRRNNGRFVAEATMCGLSARREYRYEIYELSFRVSLPGSFRVSLSFGACAGYGRAMCVRNGGPTLPFLFRHPAQRKISFYCQKKSDQFIFLFYSRLLPTYIFDFHANIVRIL